MTEQFYEKEAREKILAGAEKLYNAVKTTMGPRGRNVVIKLKDLPPIVTHDGVTVALHTNVKDLSERAGAELIKEAAEKLNDEVGDGTTTVTVLTYHMLKAAHEMIANDTTINPMLLAREVEAAVVPVYDYLESKRLPSDDLATLKKIATLSSADEEIGQVVAETIEKVGATGTVTVEPAMREDTISEVVDGVVVERGWATPYFITSVSKMQAVFEDVPVLIVDQPIHSFLELLPFLQRMGEAKMDKVVIVAEDFEGDTLDSLLKNNRQGAFRTLPIMAPSFTDHKRQLLEDLASATEATVIAHDTYTLKEAPLEVLGRAKKVVSTQTKSIFTGVEGDIEARVAEIEVQKQNQDSKFEIEKLEHRQALLKGKVATIFVGGKTETEIKERKDRVDDAVGATKASKLDGILPGGGVTLYCASEVLDDATNGSKLLKGVLKQPFTQLLDNSGLSDVAMPNMKDGYGYNVKTGELVNLIDAGIVDPYAVTKHALQSAISLGVSGMTAGALIVEQPEEEEK